MSVLSVMSSSFNIVDRSPLVSVCLCNFKGGGWSVDRTVRLPWGGVGGKGLLASSDFKGTPLLTVNFAGCDVGLTPRRNFATVPVSHEMLMTALRFCVHLTNAAGTHRNARRPRTFDETESYGRPEQLFTEKLHERASCCPETVDTRRLHTYEAYSTVKADRARIYT